MVEQLLKPKYNRNNVEGGEIIWIRFQN
jgi:hypothetical protein